MSLKNVALWFFRDGILEGQIDGSVSTWGRRETGLTLASNDGPSSLNVVEATLVPLSQPERSVTIVIEPDSDGETPYLGFDVGDWVSVATENGTELLRVASISGQRDSEGYLTFTPELITARDVQAQRYSRYLSRTNGGTADGRSRSARPNSPSIIMGSTVVTPYTDTMSTDGDYEALGFERTAPKAMDGVARKLVKVELACNDAGVGNTTIQVQKNGTDLGFSTDLIGSFTDRTDYVATHGVVYQVGDYYGIRCTAGGGHTGISATLTFVDVGG